MGISGDILRGQVDYLIVAVLLEGDNYGYGINQRIEVLSGGDIVLTEASMYTAFKRLESEGRVVSYWLDGKNNLKRKYYSLTSKGREFAKAKKEEWMRTLNALRPFYKGD